MSPALRLRYLAVLGRWCPAQASVHAFADMMERWPLFTRDEGRRKLLDDLGVTMAYWLNSFQHNGNLTLLYVRARMARMMTLEMHHIIRQLASIHAVSVDREKILCEIDLRRWTKSTVEALASIRYEHYVGKYDQRQERIVSAYFSVLVSWQAPSADEAHFPAGDDNERAQQPSFRRWVYMEEQLVRCLLLLLIDQHVADTGQTREDIICHLVQEESFRFSVSEDTFDLLYNKSVRQTAARVATEEAYEQVWKIDCNAIALIYDVAAAIDARLLVPPSPNSPTQWARLIARPPAPFNTAHFNSVLFPKL
ncbi:hypothetical protein GNI_017910, partial [Gregarina niphandrodes]